MAPKLRIYDTDTVINVGQDARTPILSSPNTQPQAPTQDPSEVVEDSMKAHERIHAESNEQTTRLDEDDDELYALSPRGRASLEMAKSSLKGCANRADGYRPDTMEDVANTDKAPVGLKSDRGSESVVRITNQFGSDQLQANDVGLSVPIGAPPYVSRKQTPTTRGTIGHTTRQERHGGVQAQPPVSKPSSALAALRAKRGTRPQTHQALNKKQPHWLTPQQLVSWDQPKARIALEERDRNLRTVKPSEPNVQLIEKHLSVGKLPSRENGTLSHTPISQPTDNRREQPPQKFETTTQLESKNGSVASSVHTVASHDGHTRAPKALQRTPGASAACGNDARRPTSELPESPNGVGAVQPARRSYADEGQATCTPETSISKRSQPSKHDINEEKSQSTVKAPAYEAPSAVKPAPVGGKRSRMDQKAASRVTQYEDRQSEDAYADVSRDNVKGTRTETIEDFEQAVLQFENGSDNSCGIGQSQKRLSVLTDAKQDTNIPLANRPADSRTMLTDAGVQLSTQPVPAQSGVSQNEPIVLSDKESSSSPASSSTGASNAENVPRTAATRGSNMTSKAPQTPAVLRSSPPSIQRMELDLQGRRLAVPEHARKATIISFNKKGPRNQGSVVAQKSTFGSAVTNKMSLPHTDVPLVLEASSSRAKLKTRQRNGPSSVASTTRSSRSILTAPPSNVADNVSDALAGFLRKYRQCEATPDKAVQPDCDLRLKPSARKKATNQPDADDGFCNVDQVEGTTLVENTPDAQTSNAKMVTEMQTASQIAMPPPAPKVTKIQKVHRAPTVPLMVGSGEHNAPSSGGNNATDNPGSKRRLERTEDLEPLPKRSKFLLTSQQPANLRSQQASEHIRPGVYRGQPWPAAPPTVESIRTLSSKPNRHVSTKSQSVDKGGSPVPKGMVVDNKATALEVFSQQAGLSSDNDPNNGVAAKERKTEDFNDRSLIQLEGHCIPPSHQREGLSSNSKPLPASPRAESQAITEFAISKVDPRRLSIRDDSVLHSTDPFTSSEEMRAQRLKVKKGSVGVEQVQVNLPQGQEGHKVNQGHRTPAHEEHEDPNRPPISTGLVDASSNRKSNSEFEDDGMRRILEWRDGLRPHQMNLFDELVDISRRLVGQLASQEAASRNAIDDFRRRGNSLVEHMEQSRAEQLLHDLAQKKTRTERDLSKCNEDLKVYGTIVAEMQERKSR